MMKRACTTTRREAVTRLVVMTAAWLAIGMSARPDGRQTGSRHWFEDVTSLVGLEFTHRNGASGEYRIQEIIGAGIGLIDYDNDDDLDVISLQGGTMAGGTTVGQAEPMARLFRNDLRVQADGTRTLRFVDVTGRAGIGPHGDGMGVAAGDYDGDGFVDLYLTALGPNALYRNRGNGTFEDVTARAGVDDPRWSTSAAFADLDADGDLDLFVTNYLDATSSGRPCFEPAGARDYCPPTRYRPVPDRLYRNRGDGTFEDVSESAGILRAFGNGLGVSIGDYDLDGRLDVYVANDTTPNQLWRNQGAGRFVDVGPLSGAAFNALGRPESSMGIASGDPDADGDEDLVVTNIVGEASVMYVNDGRGGFEDRRADVGLAHPTAAMTGFGVTWLDADNDGTTDLLAVNGAVTLIPELRGQRVPYRQRNQLFRGVVSRVAPGSDPAGSARFRLEEVGGDAAGPALAPLGVGRGLAVGDIDNDGFPDAVLTNNGGPLRVLRNTAATGHAWLGLELRQPGPNRQAIGATVVVDAGPAAGRLHRVRTDGSYLSASDPRVLVGLGDYRGTVTAVITWPDGTRQQIKPAAGRYLRVEKAAPSR
jgi:enediyne biosynthesis protein E4